MVFEHNYSTSTVISITTTSCLKETMVSDITATADPAGQKVFVVVQAIHTNSSISTFNAYFWTPVLLPLPHNIHCCYFHMVVVGLTWVSLQLIVSVCCVHSLIVSIISDNVHNIVQYVWLHVRDIESERSTP